jgi:hypothetical protein
VGSSRESETKFNAKKSYTGLGQRREKAPVEPSPPVALPGFMCHVPHTGVFLRMARGARRLQTGAYQVERVHARRAHASRYAAECEQRQDAGLVLARGSQISELKRLEGAHVDRGVSMSGLSIQSEWNPKTAYGKTPTSPIWVGMSMASRWLIQEPHRQTPIICTEPS